MLQLSLSAGWADSAIAGVYIVTNAARVFTYLPQIVAVWRSRDGARALSLITWSSWMVSHAAAIAYGVLVVHDQFFVSISLLNFCGCGAVTLIAAQRRGLLRGQRERGMREARFPIPAQPPKAVGSLSIDLLKERS